MPKITKGVSVKDLIQYAEQFASETGVIPEVHPEDYIYRFLIKNAVFKNKKEAVRYYFYDGKNSAETLKRLLFDRLNFSENNTLILEFASGYGCVTRHLVSIFSPENVVCSDIHAEANQFLSQTLQIRAIQSTTEPQHFPSDENFDVVFALSFFSHIPPPTWGHWLETLFHLVNPGGVLVFTTQGMESRKYFGNPDIPDSGIWFLADSEQKDLDVHEYGQTIVTIEYVVNHVFKRLKTPFKIIRSAYWWNHQDLYVIQKPVAFTT
jgi:2-polyprenyl-3-methyl-5-hydroxy-6-metoxy-1,4-benzoquinol methylase